MRRAFSMKAGSSGIMPGTAVRSSSKYRMAAMAISSEASVPGRSFSLRPPIYDMYIDERRGCAVTGSLPWLCSHRATASMCLQVPKFPVRKSMHSQ